MSGPAAIRLGVEELTWLVQLDDEALIGEPPVVLVDPPAVAGPAAPDLGSRPVVVIGIDRPGATWARHCDVVTDDETLAAQIVERVARWPRAAAALALLMRGRERRSIEDSLIAESATYSVLQSGPEFAAWRATNTRRPGTDDGPPVLVERAGDTLHVVLDRPRRHNAYSLAMRDALVDALRVAAADEHLTVILSGHGPSFCSGGDLAEFGSFGDPASAHAVRLTRSAARLLARLGARVEARVHGVCLGAGVELPAFAGRVIADPQTTFGLPELELGLVPGAGGTASMPPRIGRQRTAELALSGRRIDARTALEWGLVDEVCRLEELAPISRG